MALSAVRMKEWMASDLSSLDLLVIQIEKPRRGLRPTCLSQIALSRAA
jgi:hypothetical protein